MESGTNDNSANEEKYKWILSEQIDQNVESVPFESNSTMYNQYK